ncbi:MAG: AAA family ATPase [Dehalococcoidia bacterium]|nr:AAA family ATPase [Dehalococcoidia bacterium]
MTKTIAVAGKGGTGKTTIAALIIDTLSKKGSVLAIDADPASNLNMALGVPLDVTVGDVREEMLVSVKSGKFSPGIAKQDYLDIRINEALVETKEFDLLAMGRPEGPSCYCAANNMLRLCIDRLGNSYDYVVIDNEAGMEHISRQTTRDVNLLLLVSDPSVRGVTTAGRTKELTHELRTKVDKTVLVINRANSSLSPEVERVIASYGMDLAAIIPSDARVGELDAEGQPLTGLPADAPVRRAVEQLLTQAGLL